MDKQDEAKPPDGAVTLSLPNMDGAEQQRTRKLASLSSIPRLRSNSGTLRHASAPATQNGGTEPSVSSSVFAGSSRNPLAGDKVNVRANVQPQMAERDAQIRDVGNRLSQASAQFFVVSLGIGILTNWAFYAGELVLLDNDGNAQACLALVCTSFVLNFGSLIAIRGTAFVYRRDVRMKSRGIDFVVGSMLFASLTFLLALFMILQYLGYLGPVALWKWSGRLPPDSEEPKEVVVQWIVLCTLMGTSMVALNAFVACVIARMRLMYFLFARTSETVLSPRKLRWVFWQTVIALTVANLILGFLPVSLYLSIYEPDQAQTQKTIGWVVIGPLLMVCVRTSASLYYMYLTRDIELRLFHDRWQSLRLVILDAIAYITFYIMLIVVGYTSATFLMIFHLCQFHTVVYLYDWFLPVIWDISRKGVLT